MIIILIILFRVMGYGLVISAIWYTPTSLSLSGAGTYGPRMWLGSSNEISLKF